MPWRRRVPEGNSTWRSLWALVNAPGYHVHRIRLSSPLCSGPRAAVQHRPLSLRSFVSASLSALSIPLSVSNATCLVFDKLNTTPRLAPRHEYIVWGYASTELCVLATIHTGEVSTFWLNPTPVIRYYRPCTSKLLHTTRLDCFSPRRCCTIVFVCFVL
jgi:hypothetical protein